MYIGSDSLPYNTTNREYSKEYTQSLNTSNSWTVNGSNGIPSFRFTDNNAFPGCPNLIDLPDNIFKNAGITFKLNNVSNSTVAYLVIYDGDGTHIGTGFHNGNNTLTLSPDILKTLRAGESGAYIQITMKNNRSVTVAGKNFQFSKISEFNKYVEINP